MALLGEICQSLSTEPGGDLEGSGGAESGGQERGPAALCWLPSRPGGGLRRPLDPRGAPAGIEEMRMQRINT